MQSKKSKKKVDYTKTHIIWFTLAWFAGLSLIFAIWAIMGATVEGASFHMPSIGETFSGMGAIFSQTSLSFIPDTSPAYSQVGQEWAAIGIALGQTLFCFLIAFILGALIALASQFSKIIQYFIWPFATLTRALPTAVLMAVITALIAPGSAIVWLIPVIVAFFVLFPMIYEGLSNSINNVSKKSLEMANVFNVSKWQQFKSISLRAMAPYIFSTIIAGFGLTFKIVLASQLVSIALVNVVPNYPSVGQMIGLTVNQAMSVSGGGVECGIVLAWGIIAILISLIIELIIKEISRLCMPHKYRDLEVIKSWFKRGNKNDQI